jgi:PAS domain S-box-containing protein
MMSNLTKRLVDNFNRYQAVWLVVCFGIALSWAAFNFLESERLEHIHESFQMVASERFLTIKHHVNMLRSNLEDIQSLYAASNSVDRDEFRKFTRHILDRNSYLVGLGWTPLVHHDQRWSYEQKAKEYIPDFKITEPTTPGKMITASKRDEYFPLYYAETNKNSKAPLGFDLGSNPVRLAAMHLARDSGNPIVTEKVALIHDINKKSSFLIFHPIYHNNQPIQTVKQRRENLQGFVSAVFQVGDLVENSIKTLLPAGIDFLLSDEAASKEKRLLYLHSSRKYQGIKNANIKQIISQERTWKFLEKFSFAGRQWSFLAVPNRNFIEQEVFRVFPLLIFGGGVLLTALLSLYLVRSKKNLIERQLAALSLGASQMKLNSILMSTGEAIYGIDMNGNCTFCNSACTNILGYENSQSLLGKNMHDLIHHTREDGSDNPVQECKIYLAFRQGQSTHVDSEVLWRSDGTSFPVEYRSMPLRHDGQIIGAVVSFTDITTHKSNMAILKDSLEIAESASRAKSDFIANMSHEIRTPMNAIMGLTKLAIRSDPTPKLHNYLSKVEKSSHTLMSLINDILDFSRIEAGRMELNLVEFDLHDIFDRLADLFSQQSTEKEIELILSIPPDFCHVALGDSLRLEQVLINLIRNAIKFTQHGTVIVEVRSDRNESGSLEWMFCVSDTGIGIAPEILPKLFDPFEQADSSTTRNYGGTGLGLTICTRLVDMMGGRILAKSVPGEGSTFSFSIVVEYLSLEESDPPLIPNNLNSLRVLVVDDHQIARNTAHNLLKSFRFDVVSVGSGKEALSELVIANKQNKYPFTPNQPCE